MKRRCGLFPTRLLSTILIFAWVVSLPSTEAEEPKKEGKPKHTNRLARETSPYLLMHAHNPVDWYPWGPEAFAKAKKENKLIFLSIGYSSCYWCHVMERQSFQNEEIAKLMNERFVCVKVDREERPDVDSVYMTALHVQGRRGGWPLSMFLTPDGKPVGGGTYWPPEDREVEGEKAYGFKSIVKLVQDDWQNKRDVLQKHADYLADLVNKEVANASRRVVLVEPSRELVKDALDDVKAEFDSVHGGFGSRDRAFQGPKFPTPCMPELLLAEYRRTKEEALLKVLTHTLDRMAMGGIYDHLGGGFHRYSVDREWKVPHFEKMLYDNGQLVSLYSGVYQITKKPSYRRLIEETLAFIQRELTAPGGAFYSALDAETEAEEGKFYVWSAAEIDTALAKPDAELFKKAYGVAAGPNFEEKRNVLLLPKPLVELAKDMRVAEDELAAQLQPLRRQLFALRSKRARPFLDTKVLTGWNGLMIAGYADAAIALGNPSYAATAERAAEFLLQNLRTKDGRLLRTYSAQPGGKGEARLNAYLEDYAFLVHGLLRLHAAAGKKRWLDEAAALTETMIRLHHDKETGGFFFASHDHEQLFAKAKDQFDGATPSGNSVAALNLVELAAQTGEVRFAKHAAETFKTFAGPLKANPGGLTAMARALSAGLDKQVLMPRTAQAAQSDPLRPKDKESPAKEEPVQVSAAVVPGTPGADGKQTVILTLDIAKGWHTYANPTGSDLLKPTTVSVSAAAKLEDVQVEYPQGVEKKDSAVERPIRVYEGKTTIKVSFRRTIIEGKRDASPVEVTVKYQACDSTRCLPPKTVKLIAGKRD